MAEVWILVYFAGTWTVMAADVAEQRARFEARWGDVISKLSERTGRPFLDVDEAGHLTCQSIEWELEDFDDDDDPIANFLANRLRKDFYRELWELFGGWNSDLRWSIDATESNGFEASAEIRLRVKGPKMDWGRRKTVGELDWHESEDAAFDRAYWKEVDRLAQAAGRASGSETGDGHGDADDASPVDRTLIWEAVLLPGDRLATVGDRSDEHGVTIWDLARGRVVQELEADGAHEFLYDLRALPDGRLLAVDGYAVMVWSPDPGGLFQPQNVFCTWVPDEKGLGAVYCTALSVAGAFPRLLYWSRGLWTLDLKRDVIARFVHLDDTLSDTGGLWIDDRHRERLVTWSVHRDVDPSFIVWDLMEGTRVSEAMHPAVVTDVVRVGADALVSSSEDGLLRRWDLGTGALLDELPGHHGAVRGIVAIAGTDQRLISFGDDGTLRCWRTDTWQCDQMLKGHEAGVRGARQLNGGGLLSWGRDHTVRIWDPATGSIRQVLRGHTGGICGALEMDDGTIVSYAEDGTIKLWKRATGECVRTLVEPVAAEGLDP